MNIPVIGGNLESQVQYHATEIKHDINRYISIKINTITFPLLAIAFDVAINA